MPDVFTVFLYKDDDDDCLSSQNYIAKSELSMWINVFWFLNQISVDIIWWTSFHIYKTIPNI